jgi:hypothetical protein
MVTNTAGSPMRNIFTGIVQIGALPEPLLERFAVIHTPTTCKSSAGLKDVYRWDRHVAAMPTGFVKKLFLGAAAG